MNNDFAYSSRNCWEVYADRQCEMDELAERYMAFLSASKTERETVNNVTQILRAASYSEDFANERVFRHYRGKAIFVARRGRKPLRDGVRLISAHTDAPRLIF